MPAPVLPSTEKIQNRWEITLHNKLFKIVSKTRLWLRFFFYQSCHDRDSHKREEMHLSNTCLACVISKMEHILPKSHQILTFSTFVCPTEKCRSEEDLKSMDSRNKITQDMLQPKVERSFSDEEGSSDYLFELSDNDSDSSDIR